MQIANAQSRTDELVTRQRTFADAFTGDRMIEVGVYK